MSSAPWTLKIRARKPTTEVVEGITIATSRTPIRTDRRPPLRRENALPPCPPDEAETYDPFEGESLDSQGLPTPVVTEEEAPPPRPRKRRKRNTPLGPAGPEFDGREGDHVMLTNGEIVFVHDN